MPKVESSSPDAAQTEIHLPLNFGQSHRQVITRYLRGHETLSSKERLLLIQAMDMLRRARVRQGKQGGTFAAIYDRIIDAIYANNAIEQLLVLADPEHEYEALRAATSRRILTDLRASGLWRADLLDSQLLVAFCLYWWQMFVRGYAFEITIYRDLSDSKVAYTAHDLRNRQARLTGHDLEVMGFRGDIKTSTYFALTYRSEMLAHDFYITRMYHNQTQHWYRVVWLKLPFWHTLNGETKPVLYKNIWQVLPDIAQVKLHGQEFVVLLYEEWKQRVIAQQI